MQLPLELIAGQMRNEERKEGRKEAEKRNENSKLVIS